MMYATSKYPPIIPKVSNIAWVLLNPGISKEDYKMDLLQETSSI